MFLALFSEIMEEKSTLLLPPCRLHFWWLTYPLYFPFLLWFLMRWFQRHSSPGGSSSSDIAPNLIPISPNSFPQLRAQPKPTSLWHLPGHTQREVAPCRGRQHGFGITQTRAWFLASTFTDHESLGMLRNLSLPRCSYVSRLCATYPILNVVLQLSRWDVRCLSHRKSSVNGIFSFISSGIQISLFWT